MEKYKQLVIIRDGNQKIWNNWDLMSVLKIKMLIFLSDNNLNYIRELLGYLKERPGQKSPTLDRFAYIITENLSEEAFQEIKGLFLSLKHYPLSVEKFNADFSTSKHGKSPKLVLKRVISNTILSKKNSEINYFKAKYS